MESLHKVTQEELQILLEWLSQHLPDAYTLYGGVYEVLKGRWQGPTYYTLGWPDILAAGTGPYDETKSKCADFFNAIQQTSLYAPKPEHAEQLLLTPGFLDWTKPILFCAVSFEMGNVVEKVSKDTGTPHKTRNNCSLMAAYPGDNKVRNGDCVACELGNEYAFSALLHVRDEIRGRGLATAVVSHLAQKYFKENRPILAAVVVSNKPAMDTHTKLGFKTIGQVCWYVHTMAGEKLMHYQ